MRRSPTSVTDHAVDRYVERHRPGWDFEAARKELLREVATATFYEHPPGEEAIWRTRSGRLLVVRGDGAVATVLPAGSRRPDSRRKR